MAGMLVSPFVTDPRRDAAARIWDVGTEEINGTTYITIDIAGTIGEILFEERLYAIAYQHFPAADVWMSVSIGYTPVEANDVLPPMKFTSGDATRGRLPEVFRLTMRSMTHIDALMAALVGMELRALLLDGKLVDQFGSRIHVKEATYADDL